MRQVTCTFVALTLTFGLAQAVRAQDPAQDKKQVAFIGRTMQTRLGTIRDQLRANKLDLAEQNIRGMTEQLAEMARLTRRIRAKEPGFAPKPPAGCKPGPASARQAEYLEAKKLAIAAGKQLNRDAQAANQALLAAKKRQIATIAISALKFTVENAPGRQGGKLADLAVEGVKKLNGYLLDTYVSQPITGISEVALLKGNFVSIRDGARLLAGLEKAREKVIALARSLDGQAKSLNRAVAAEREWQQHAWMCGGQASTLRVKVLDFRARDLELSLAGRKLGPSSKGQTLVVDQEAILSARVLGPKRKFCLERKEYAQRTKSIIIHPGPGGGPDDSLVYSSSRIPAKSSWLIQSEQFDWQPSFNSKVEDAPPAVAKAYWKQKRQRVRWLLQAKPGEQVNVKVDGKIDWRFESNIRGKKRTQQETNDGTATLVLQILK